MSTKELKRHLVGLGVSVDGCFEHSDFLELAERTSRAAPSAAAGAGCQSESATDRLRREREDALAAKRALAEKQLEVERREREAKRDAAKVEEERKATRPADGGYVVDMFGVKRGASTRDSTCWRFDPPPLTAGRVLASNNCRTCKHSANDHEDFGPKAHPDEPDLVDERGYCYRRKVSGGGGAHDSATYTFELMVGVTAPPRQSRTRLNPVATRTGAASPASATLTATPAEDTGRAAQEPPAASAAAAAAAAAAAEAEAAAALAARMRAARDID